MPHQLPKNLRRCSSATLKARDNVNPTHRRPIQQIKNKEEKKKRKSGDKVLINSLLLAVMSSSNSVIRVLNEDIRKPSCFASISSLISRSRGKSKFWRGNGNFVTLSLVRSRLFYSLVSRELPEN
ncbi:hypothetical protein SLE2022_067970 [Rubroshorea leprosula]